MIFADPNLFITISLGGLAAGAALLVCFTDPGSALRAYAICKAWRARRPHSFAAWLERRGQRRRYHRDRYEHAKCHAKPTRRQARELARHAASPAAPDAAPQPASDRLTPGQQIREIQEVFGSAARIVPEPEPLWRATTLPDIRKFARHA